MIDVEERQEGLEDDLEPWPAWSRDRGYARLAEYVGSVTALDGLDLGPVEMLHDEKRSRAELLQGRAAALYELLRKKKPAYLWERRLVTSRAQHIRDPWGVLDERGGTCLDLATTYATMCMASYVDILLAVIPATVISAGHAFVVLSNPRDEAAPTGLVDLGFRPSRKEEGVFVGKVATLNQAAADRLLISVEPTYATTTRGARDWTEAAAYDPRDDGWSDESEVRLVDVPMLQTNGCVKALPPLRRPAIRSYIPSTGVGFREYESDKELIAELKDQAGSLVIYGPPGQGKSMVARHLAEGQAGGTAWFLDASEPQALIHSLASARADEAGRGLERLDTLDREGRAFEALGRLRQVERGWLVVLDNANGNPNQLRKWLPPTEGKEGRRIVVTTTNPEWKGFQSFDWVPLGELDARDLPGFDPALAELVNGRRLMLEAFRALLERTDVSVSDIVERAPGAADARADEELRGPIAYWEGLRRSEGFGEPWLRLCAFAAYLPPDNQPVPALTELVGEEAVAAVGSLRERGLFGGDAEGTEVRLHRLFGEAIRRFLDDERPELRDEVVLALGRRKAAIGVLDRYGDLDTVRRLDDRLAEIDGETGAPDEHLGSAEHEIAGLLERFGQSRLSGAAYERAERHLSDQPQRIAECLLGRARPINQHHKKEPGLLRQAIGWSRQARELLGGEESVHGYRALAMEGLLTRALSSFPDREKNETSVELLHRTMDMLQEADKGRQGDPDVSEEEKARSRFNLAGTWLRLAQEEPDQAQAHLDEAADVYKEVLNWRHDLYQVSTHPHIAACEAGLGYVSYYRATLIPASPEQRSEWLRDATERTINALGQWETLDGPVDVDEAPKSATFLAKVALARASSPVAPEAAPAGTFRTAMRELTPPRIVLASVSAPAADGSDVADAIAAWARSPALDELVRVSGGTVPGGLELPELLAWLEEFSQAWDFRGGQERNLFPARSLDLVADKTIRAAATALGLVKGGARPHGRYDHVLILGGLARACLARPLAAARLLSAGPAEAEAVTALGGYRRLKGDEVGMVEQVAGAEAGAATVGDEFDAMEAGVKLAFGLGVPERERGERSELEFGSWRVHEYATAAGLPVRVVAAPSSEPEVRRTNTADSYQWFATEEAQLRPGQRLLLVTSDIYVPFQHADALRVLGLPYGVAVETMGIQPGDVDPRLSQVFSADAYLQEVRSTIMAMGRLLAAIA